MRKFLLVLAFGIATGNMIAADLFGRWVGNISSRDGVGATSERIYLTLQQTGGAVSGTIAYQDEMRKVKLENAEIKGDQLTFEVHDNPTRVVKFRLKMGESALSGDATSGNRVASIALTRPN